MFFKSKLSTALAATLCALALSVGAAKAECPFNEALNYHLVSALKAAGATDEQFEALAAAGEIRLTVPQACMAEQNYAMANPDTECQRANGVTVSRLSSYLVVSAYLFAVTGDARTYRSNIRAILANHLNFVPHRCWFQGVAAVELPNQGSPGVSGAGLTPAQCAGLRANFQACQQQANSALQRCTVTPHARNCAYTAPTCTPPPC